MSERVFNQKESVIGRFGIEYASKNRGDHEGDQPFRQSDHRKTHNPHRQPYLVWLDVMQQSAEFFPFRQGIC